MPRLCYDFVVGVMTLIALADVTTPFIRWRDSNMMSSMLLPFSNVATLLLVLRLLMLMSRLCYDIVVGVAALELVFCFL